jgi:glutathione S-transferase
MLLIGRNLSPFVRRVAATLNLLGLRFEQKPLTTLDHKAEIAGYNPVGRVPSLVLDDGETLVDSAAILDALDEMVGPARALLPASGAERRAALRALALAIGAAEKAVAAYAERDRRPKDLVWAESVDRLLAQAAGGLEALDRLAAQGPFLAAGRMTQADVTAAIVLDFVDVVHPALAQGRWPALAALRDRMNAIPAIGGTRWTG